MSDMSRLSALRRAAIVAAAVALASGAAEAEPPTAHRPVAQRAVASKGIDLGVTPRPQDDPWRRALPSIRRIPLHTEEAPGSILVSLADRRLYFVTRPGEALAYPIAIPRPDSVWRGRERVRGMREWPLWRPTEAMRREDPTLPYEVAGGAPDNPLGARALYLGGTLYRIHGTDAPWTIGSDVSLGCIRMLNAHVIDLYDRVRLGASVVVVEPSLIETRLAASRDDRSAQ